MLKLIYTLLILLPLHMRADILDETIDWWYVKKV